MGAQRMQDLDRIILRYCEHDFVRVHDLLTHVARGTLYRHIANLVDLGLLAKRGHTYRTTEQGKRRLEELSSNMNWNIWDEIYSPMRDIPSAQHRSVIELATASVVVR